MSGTKQDVIDNLESRELELAKLVTILTAQGYVVNRNKLMQLKWIVLLKKAYTRIELFTNEQINQLNVLRIKVNRV